MHAPEARHDVLDRAGEQISVMRMTCGEGGTVVEAKGLAPFSCAYAPTEHVFFFPVLEDSVFELREGLLWVDRIEWHGWHRVYCMEQMARFRQKNR